VVRKPDYNILYNIILYNNKFFDLSIVSCLLKISYSCCPRNVKKKKKGYYNIKNIFYNLFYYLTYTLKGKTNNMLFNRIAIDNCCRSCT